MLFAGGAGTLAVGPLADRIGRRPVLLASVVSVPPLTLVYVAVGGTVGVVALALVGVCVVGTFGLIQVMTQEYMPNRLGLASGISIGFAIGLGGVAAARRRCRRRRPRGSALHQRRGAGARNPACTLAAVAARRR